MNEAQVLLFVDNELSFLDAIARHFDRIGYHQAIFATTTDEAWGVVRSGAPVHQIICDLRMPGGGALEFLTRVHRVNPAISLTLLSAWTEDLAVEDWATLSALKANVVGKSSLSPEWLGALVSNPPVEVARNVTPPRSTLAPAPVDAVNDVFDVFLSYNSKDRPEVRPLAEQLRGERIRIWFDEWELVPGRPWQEALELMIERTKTAAVLIGQSGLGPWEIPEMRVCLSEFVSRRMPVIPVLLPGAKTQPALPLFLRQFTWVDMRSGVTPECIQRLKWGITGQKSAPCNDGA